MLLWLFYENQANVKGVFVPYFNSKKSVAYLLHRRHYSIPNNRNNQVYEKNNYDVLVNGCHVFSRTSV